MKYLDLDCIYGLYMYLDLDLLVVDLCPSLIWGRILCNPMGWRLQPTRGSRALGSFPPLSSRHHNLEPLGRWRSTESGGSDGIASIAVRGFEPSDKSCWAYFMQPSLGAIHPYPHATVTWSPWVGGKRQYIYDCCVPARWGLWQTTLAPGSNKTQVQGSFGSVNRWTKPYKPLKIKKDGPTIGPALLRQGEPGTSHYILLWRTCYSMAR